MNAADDLRRFMIYGANGYTGVLIAEEAVRRGLAPILAGRNREAHDALGQRLETRVRVFDLDDPAAVDAQLDDVDLLLNCAGPFSQTASPLLDACLRRRIHYLDITGEIDVFALCHGAHARAVERGIVVLPGVGFDVVPTDGVAAMLAERLPDATHLVLAFEAGGGASPGTARTGVEGLAKGGRARSDGVVVEVPIAWKTRCFERDGLARTAMTIPWGDVYTAFVTTGIANVEVYMAMSPRSIAQARWLRHARFLLRLAPLRRWLGSRAAATKGPDAARRAATTCQIWGEVRNAAGNVSRMAIVTPNGYALTVLSALDMVRDVLSRPLPAGYATPSQRMGAAYVLGLPGVSIAPWAGPDRTVAPTGRRGDPR